MKKALLAVPGIFLIFVVQATTYYSVINTSPNTAANWHINRNGTGSSPSNFNNNGDIFVIQGGQSLTTTGNWNINGTNAKLLIETGATLQADDKVQVDIFEIQGTGTYIHNKNNNNFPGANTRTFAATSTVELRDWSGSAALPSPTTWGNIIINLTGYSANINQAGGLTDVAGNLDIRSVGNSTDEFRLSTSQSYTLTIGGNLIIESGVLEAGNANGNYTQQILIGGSYIQTGGTFTRSNNNANTLKVQFNGVSSAFNKTGGTITNTYIDWAVNASKKLTLSTDFPVATSRSFTVNGTLDCGLNKVSGAGAFTLPAAGTLITANTSGINGSIIVTGTATYTSGASYEFDGTTATPFPTALASVTASRLTIGADVTLNKNVSVSTTLSLSTGKLTIPTGFTATVSSGSVITGSGFGSSKQIVTQVNTSTGAKGILRVSALNGSGTFPIGNGTYYLPITLTTTSSNDFSLTVFQGVTSNGTPNGPAFPTSGKLTIVDAVWIVNRNSGSNNVNMGLAWPAALEGSIFHTLANNEIGIAHYGTYWESPLGTGNQSLNTVTRSGITTFSPFAIGQVGAPLPLKFGNVKVYEVSNNMNVDWTSYNEFNLDHFEIQRSQNGQQFNTIGTVAAKNNNSKADYSWTDSSPLNNVSFYRISGVDIDGKENYSTVIKVDRSQTNSELSLFPNPVTDKRISLQAGSMVKGDYKIFITNLYGRTVYNQSLEHSGGVLSQIIQLPTAMPAGMYTLSITGSGINMLKQFVVK